MKCVDAGRTVGVDAVTTVLRDYAALQRRTAGRGDELVRAGLRVPHPLNAAELAGAQPERLAMLPLHRTAAWLGVLQDADDAAIAAHGRTAWAWLEDVTKPVLLTTGTDFGRGDRLRS